MKKVINNLFPYPNTNKYKQIYLLVLGAVLVCVLAIVVSIMSWKGLYTVGIILGVFTLLCLNIISLSHLKSIEQSDMEENR